MSLSPLVVLVSVLLGVELGGILGALFAIPAAGVVRVVARDIWDTHRGRSKEEATVGRAQVPASQAEDRKEEAAFVTIRTGELATASELVAAPDERTAQNPPD